MVGQSCAPHFGLMHHVACMLDCSLRRSAHFYRLMHSQTIFYLHSDHASSCVQDKSGYVLFVRLVGLYLDYQTWEAWGPGAQVEVEGAR
jgi:hypothetical protein